MTAAGGRIATGEVGTSGAMGRRDGRGIAPGRRLGARKGVPERSFAAMAIAVGGYVTMSSP